MSDKGHRFTELFNPRASVEPACRPAPSRGYDSKDINLVMSYETRQQDFSGTALKTEQRKKAAKGAGNGGAIRETLSTLTTRSAAVCVIATLPGSGAPGVFLENEESNIRRPFD